jgi:hypothetical protein
MGPTLLALAIILLPIALLPIACSYESPEADSTAWQGTITTEDGVTTVVNESGSVWGGTARLIEEASIGVAEGEAAYMLGGVGGIAAFGPHIFVLDMQVPIIRVYGESGVHVRDIGARGQGPGEFERPAEMALGPDGRLYVKDGNRVTVFSPEGDYLESWVDAVMTISLLDFPCVVTDEGQFYAPKFSSLLSPIWEMSMVPAGPGPAGRGPISPPALDYTPQRLPDPYPGGEGIPVPFGAEILWAMSTAGRMVAGASNQYRFLVVDAEQTLVVHKFWDPVPVQPEEAQWHEQDLTARMRRHVPGWIWDGPGIPSVKPAYEKLLPDRSGRIWVLGAGRGFLSESCRGLRASRLALSGDDACWDESYLLDVFGEDGRYLGQVLPPAGLQWSPQPFIEGSFFVGAVEDEAGTIMVKRYRLVLPGEE